MIQEFLRHLLTAAPEHIKKMGYLAESIAIDARQARCKAAWTPHLETTKDTIADECARLGSLDTINVYGAGGLYDVPLERLNLHAATVNLTDIVVLKRARKLTQGLDHLRLVEHDITEYAKPFYEFLTSSNSRLPDVPMHPDLSLGYKPDLAISLNLISQLAIPFYGSCEKYGKTCKPEKLHRLLATAHLNGLKALGCPVLIIADIERVYEENGQEIDREPALPPDLLDMPYKSWWWDIAPKGEANRTINIRHHVGAWRL